MKGQFIGLPCALLNGRIIPIEEAIKGTKGYICPACREAIFAKKGKKRAHHFAHASGRSCSSGYESALHYMAKEIIKREKLFRIPDLYESYAKVDCQTVFVHDGKVYLAYPLALTVRPQEHEIRLETKLQNRIPDIQIELEGKTLVIEIFVTHKVDETKLEEYRQNGVSAVEVDLSGFQVTPPLEKFTQILCHSTEHKEWLNNRLLPIISQEIQKWEKMESKEKLLIFAPLKMFKREQVIDPTMVLKPFEVINQKEKIIDTCPRKVHYSTCKAFTPPQFHANTEDCATCEFFSGTYERKDPSLKKVLEEGVVCQADMNQITLDGRDVERWIQEYVEKEHERIRNNPQCRLPSYESWRHGIGRRLKELNNTLEYRLDEKELDKLLITYNVELYCQKSPYFESAFQEMKKRVRSRQGRKF